MKYFVKSVKYNTINQLIKGMQDAENLRFNFEARDFFDGYELLLYKDSREDEDE
ncbi:hypothetical protein [Salicibibacter kimchii]|uniref:hypothetical protein n=1 Tax=Salicibibacter kimchii TaxID=2099786 RepID=UPI001357327D|nr:hypothetical protein [Salicibibacter kimchii]